MERILAKGKALKNPKDSFHTTPLLQAGQHGHVKIVQLLKPYLFGVSFNDHACREWAYRHFRILSNSANIWPASTSWSEGTFEIYEAAMPTSYQWASPPKTGSAFAHTLEQKFYRSQSSRQSPAFSYLPISGQNPPNSFNQPRNHISRTVREKSGSRSEQLDRLNGV